MWVNFLPQFSFLLHLCAYSASIPFFPPPSRPISPQSPIWIKSYWSKQRNKKLFSVNGTSIFTNDETLLALSAGFDLLRRRRGDAPKIGKSYLGFGGEGKRLFSVSFAYSAEISQLGNPSGGFVFVSSAQHAGKNTLICTHLYGTERGGKVCTLDSAYNIRGVLYKGQPVNVDKKSWAKNWALKYWRI